MITDEEMIRLGFRKRKTYKKKQTGISSFCWEKYGLILTIEKDLGSDFGDEYFMPTLRTGGMIRFFREESQLVKLLEALKIN